MSYMNVDRLIHLLEIVQVAQDIENTEKGDFNDDGKLIKEAKNTATLISFITVKILMMNYLILNILPRS